MKKLSYLLAAMLLLSACEKAVMPEESESETPAKIEVKKFKFTVKGDFGATRSYLRSEGNQMTDLWVFDSCAAGIVHTLHQVPTDSDWGQPSLSLCYGEHHIYFVASRGVGASVDSAAHTITWENVKDTYWKDYEVNVVSTSNGNRAVTLDRAVTKLKITATDKVPSGAASVVITPGTWYTGINYLTGAACDAIGDGDRSISIPTSYIGTFNLSLSIYGISSTSEWTTDVTLTAKNSSGGVIGHSVLSSVPFKRNRATEYSGPLFSSGGDIAVGINDAWEDSYIGNW